MNIILMMQSSDEGRGLLRRPVFNAFQLSATVIYFSHIASWCL